MSRSSKRNYSFKNSRRLPESKMTEINGIIIPSMPGCCYHGILCALAENRDRFCTWDKIFQLTEKYMRQYGGRRGWEQFVQKRDVKSVRKRIRDNVHTLTRTGKDCYGRRLHERGMAIYFFRDGVMLLTGGVFRHQDTGYTVEFVDGRGLQQRYRGTAMTFREYTKFCEMGFIDASGRILDKDAIKKIRRYVSRRLRETVRPKKEEDRINVCVTLGETYDQETANRLESLGFIVDEVLGNEIIGSIKKERLYDLRSDPDVAEVDQESS